MTEQLLNILTATVTGIAVFLLSLLYSSGQIPGALLFALTGFLVVVWTLIMSRRRIRNLLTAPVGIDQIQAVLERYTLPGGRAMFTLQAHTESALRNRLASCNRRNRPIVFLQLRPSRYLAG